MKKTLLTVSIASIVGLGSLATGFPLNSASANSKIDSLKNQKSEIQEKKSQINSDISEKNNQLNEVKNEQEVLNKEIKRIDLAVADTTGKIEEKEIEIKETDANIKELKGEIEVLSQRIDKRNELLKDRARSFQENGRITYFDVLLGAKSFSDFIDRIGAVAVFVEADQNILREHKSDKDELEGMQREMEETLAQQQKMHSELESMKKTLASQKSEKEKVMSSLKKEEEHMHAEMGELEEQEQFLASQEKAMQKAIELEQKRLAEEERKRKAAAAVGSVAAPPISSGFFTRPSAGYLSSGFGQRSLGNHKGIDIAASGNVPIVAAASGVIIRADYSSSYGNVVYISHYIEGQVYTTVYAHMSRLDVSSGQVVSKGQQIGMMGNTGHSFGQHLHFELHKGPWAPGQPNAINPIGIVPI